MKRAVYAISAAAIAFIAAGTMLNATPIAPIAAVTNTASTNSGQVMRLCPFAAKCLPKLVSDPPPAGLAWHWPQRIATNKLPDMLTPAAI